MLFSRRKIWNWFQTVAKILLLILLFCCLFVSMLSVSHLIIVLLYLCLHVTFCACMDVGFQVNVDAWVCCTMLWVSVQSFGYVCLCVHVCAHVSVRTCVFVTVYYVSEVPWYSGGVWSLHLLRTSEGVKSSDCPNRSHWDSNPRLSCAWASSERQDRKRGMCVSLSGRMRERGMGRDGGQKRKGGSEFVWRSNGDL